MIKFRQKIFVLPLLAAAAPVADAVMVGGTVVSIGQASKQRKLQEEQNEQMMMQQRKLEKKTQEALNRVAKAAEKSPSVAAKTAEVMRERSYAVSASALKGVLQKGGQTVYEFARGINNSGNGHQIKKVVGRGLAMGTTMAGIGYGVDKAIQADRKRLTGEEIKAPEVSKEEKQKKAKKTVAKVGTTALALGAAVYGAKKGHLGEGFKNLYTKAAKATPQQWKSKATGLGKEYVKGFKEQFVKENGKVNVGGTAMTLGFGAMGGLGYLGERKQLKAQAAEQEKKYSDNNDQPKKGSALKKLAIGTAAVVGTAAAARRGAFGAKTAMKANDIFMTYGKNLAKVSKPGGKVEALGKKMLESGADKYGKAAVKYNQRTLDKIVKTGDSAFETLTKKAGKLSEEEVKNLGLQVKRGNLAKAAPRNWDATKIGQARAAHIAKGHTGRTLTGTITEGALSGASGLMGVGKKTTGGFLRNMASNPNNSETTKKTAAWLLNHKKTALAGSVAVGALGFKPWTYGEKAVRGIAGAVDKNAFAYEKSKEQEI